VLCSPLNMNVGSNYCLAAGGALVLTLSDWIAVGAIRAMHGGRQAVGFVTR
jgi:hypothetical protein